MNSDFRISVDFWQHPKTKKLIRRLGLEAVRSLQILWAWTASNRPSGSLAGMDEEDVELAADWGGEIGALIKAFMDLHWLDKTEDGYILHDWQANNPWAADADFRADKARLARLRQVNVAAYEKCVAEGKTSVTIEEYERLKKYSASHFPANSEIVAGEPLASSQQNADLQPAPFPSPVKDIKNTNVFLSKSPDFDEQDDPLVDDAPVITQGELVPSSQKIECPQQKILSLYREILPSLPDVRTLRPNLQSQVRARWNEKCHEKGFSSQEEGLEYFRKFFTYVSNNDFLTGRKNTGQRKWRCSYAWLMKAENFDKVTSGYYSEGDVA
jgi:hypothetical protein